MTYLFTNNIKMECPTSENETSYGHCRCCLEEGNHRDITKVYDDDGANEVYADIFLDCFNVFLSTHTNLSTLICAACVGMLRQARDFKALVMRTESQLMDALQNCDSEQMVLVNVPVAKDSLDTTIGFQIHVNNCDGVKREGLKKSINPVNHPIKVEVATPETNEVCTENSCNFDAETVVSNINMQQKSLIKCNKYVAEKNLLKKALIFNTYQLLASSNSTLFKGKIFCGFRCFYCKHIFEDFNCLKQHQNEQHMKIDLLRALKAYSAENLCVYADIKDLKCTKCDSPMPNLKELKSHLINTHQVKFRKNVKDRIVPFKVLESMFECPVCSCQFENYGSIAKHMNTHFRNYVCNVCGDGFVTTVRLKSHIYSRHREGYFLCEYCDKVFKTRSKLKCHIDFVHRMVKKFRCKKCPECFSDYFVLKKHMVEVHGEEPTVYRCKVCDKGFRRRYTLSCHIKRHLYQKDICCDVCPYTCYTNTELKEHKLKHNPLNIEELICSICEKLFTRKKYLKKHMQNHFDGGPHMCDICNKFFEHKYSLKIHKETKHFGDSGIVIEEGVASFEDRNELGVRLGEHSPG